MAKVIAENPLTKLYAIEKGDLEIPRGANVVASNGVFHTSNSDIFNVVRRTSEIFSGFGDLREVAEMRKKIPANVFWVGPRWLYKMWNTKGNKEYIILLFYNRFTEQFSWYPPQQTGTVASLNYDQAADPGVLDRVSKGDMLVGTMHNHFGKRGSAFQSGTDKHDEENFAGIGVHFTMGYMDAPSVYMAEFHTRIVSGKFSKVINLRDAVEDFEDAIELPEDWDAKVEIPATATRKKYLIPPKGNGSHFSRGKMGFFGWSSPDDDDDDEISDGIYEGEVVPGSSRDMMEFMLQEARLADKEYEKVFYNGAEEEGFYLLEDLGTFVEDANESDNFEQLGKDYPDIRKWAGGESLLKAAAMVSELAEAIDAHVKIRGTNTEREQELCADVANAAEYIEQKIGEFLEGQKDAKCKKQQDS